MARNYKKEAAWSRDKYTELRASIEPELADALKEYLAAQNITYAHWLRNAIRSTINRPE